MNIIQNFVNGPVNFKKLAEDFVNKDRSITASYARVYVNRSLAGIAAIGIAVTVIGCFYTMVRGGGDNKLINNYERQQDRRGNRPGDRRGERRFKS